MDGGDGLKRVAGTAYVVLGIGSLMLMFGAVYLTSSLSILYGVGIGIVSQSTASNTPVTSPGLLALAGESSTIGRGILESYVLFVISLAATAAAFFLLLGRHEKPTHSVSRYTTVNALLAVVYTLVFFIASSSLTAANNPYLYVGYAGFLVCIGTDLYLEYLVRRRPFPMAATAKRSMAIDPSKPFSNMMQMREGLLANLSGHLMVVDKHFNSAALSNFYRLFGSNMSNFSRITVLTSREMLNAAFPDDVKDFRSELGGTGVALEVRIMDDRDSVEQHERMLLDDRTAYKIPPFNIINKRSEHITKINFKEARNRFEQLYGRAIKLENYEEKKGRGT